MKTQKSGLHPRNRHHQCYDLPALCQAHPDLQGYITPNPLGGQITDFANPQAVKALNKALLAHFYVIKHWDIPDGFLCPSALGHTDYIHHLADLSAQDNGEVPKQATILDIGTDVNPIYPLIGVYEYGWRFTGSEVSPRVFASAQAAVNGNSGLTRQICLRRQKESQAIFHGMIHKDKTYDTTLCNPPFHDSAESARMGGERKRRNFGLGADNAPNFGGQQQELWCEGGEVAFISQMIRESQAFARQVKWFTSLVSRGDNLLPLYRLLAEVEAVKVVKKEMVQGQKQSRFITRSSMDDAKRRRPF